MTLVKVKDIDLALEVVGDNLLPDDASPDNSVIKEQLRQAFATMPERMLFLIVLDENVVQKEESETNEPALKAFLIAAAPPGHTHAFIHQAWAAPDSGRTIDWLFIKVMNWSWTLGLTEVFMQTSRDSLAMTRRWHFEPVSTTMRFQITDDWEKNLALKMGHTSLVEAFSGAKKNGQIKQTTDDVNSDGRTEGVREGVGDVSVAEGGTGSDPIRGSDSAGVDSTVSADTGSAVQPDAAGK